MDIRDFPFLFVTGIIMVGAYAMGWKTHENNMQTNAVKANAAYWTVDEKGVSKFHWITE